MTADDAVTSALEALAAALDALGAPAMIIGGLAVIVRGCREQRSTSTRPCGVKGLTSGTPVDVSLARLPFEELALARATRLDLGGPRLPVVSVEDLII